MAADQNAASTLQRVAGVVASAELGMKVRPDDKLTREEQLIRRGQRELLRLVQEALNG